MKTSALVKNRIKDARCAVLGLGVSNIPLVEILLECGNQITVHDKNSIEQLGEKACEFEKCGVKFVTGENYLDQIDADIIFRSPGIRPDYKGITNAVANGAELTSEMELFLELTPAKILAVTGSDGKTTTTTVSYKLLAKEFENSGRNIYVGGNIGTPLLSKLGEMTDNDICVLELSSFQLFTMKNSPSRAVITNLSPNHLDWHKDMNEYVDAKTNIFKYGAEELITNANNEFCTQILADAKCKAVAFSAHLDKLQIKEFDNAYFLNDGYICHRCNGEFENILNTQNILVPGIHNIENYMAAIALTDGLVSNEAIKYVATTFGGVEHRLEFVRELDGVKYYNSSIDSSPSRTAAALSALNQKPRVMCGGYDKQIPFEPLADALIDRAKIVVLTGATADKIYACLCQKQAKLPTYIELDFERAVNKARELARKDDIVLLSPACASFDAFKNFMERGNKFKQIVNDFR